MHVAFTNNPVKFYTKAENALTVRCGRFLVFMAYAVSSVALCLLAVWLGHMAEALI